MRIKHTPSEGYKLYFFIDDNLFKDYHFWYLYKIYSSKQCALNAVKRINDKRKNTFIDVLRYKIVWYPYPFCDDKECITVYEDEVKENER